MTKLPSLVTYALHASGFLKYGVLVVAAAAEGPIVTFVAGFLVHTHALIIIPAFISLMLGDLIGDTFWYFVGYRSGHAFIKRFGKYIGVTEESVVHASDLFKRKKGKILILSKITNGFGLSLAVLLTAGMVRIPYRTFLFFNMLGELVWTGLLFSAGYYFGSWYTQVNSVLGKVSLVFGGAVLIFILLRVTAYAGQKASTVSSK